METNTPTERNYCGPKVGSNSESATQRVVKTETGKKYHLENSMLGSPRCNPNREIDEEFVNREMAEKKNLEPCDSCFPGGAE